MCNLKLIFIFEIAFLCTNTECWSTTSLLTGVLNLASNTLHQFQNEPQDTVFVRKEYDFIIVGAGSAGCVLANRLSENPEWDVLLLEAGGMENFYRDIPGLAFYQQFTSANWKYDSEPSENGKYCNALRGKRCPWPRGKGIGGSSAINFMLVTRGTPADYDEWAEMGNEDWSYQDVLPYFKKLENFHISSEYVNESLHGYDGPITVAYPTYWSKISELIINASQELGFNYIDYNGDHQIGISRFQNNIKDNIRESSSRIFLHPIKNRPNLHVKKLSMAKKILIDSETKTAFGIEYVNAGKTYQVKAKMEVIVSAGAVNSPQLLMLSGVGPLEQLNRLSIPVIKNASVGANLMDHVGTGGLIFTVNQSDTFVLNLKSILQYIGDDSGVFVTPGTLETILYSDSNSMDFKQLNGRPDIEIFFASSSFAVFEEIAQVYGLSDTLAHQMYDKIHTANTFMPIPIVLKPKSRGRIELRDANYKSKPLIYPNYFHDPRDLDVAVKGIQLAINISQQPSLQAVGAEFYKVPPPACKNFQFGSKPFFECFVKEFTYGVYHACGTCKMGPDTDTELVVDSRLRVKGVKGLRVIDASVMPVIPGAHLNFPTMMIAERGADFIREYYNFTH